MYFRVHVCGGSSCYIWLGCVIYFFSYPQNPPVQPPSPHTDWYRVDSGSLLASLWSRLELVCRFLKEHDESLFPKPPTISVWEHQLHRCPEDITTLTVTTQAYTHLFGLLTCIPAGLLLGELLHQDCCEVALFSVTSDWPFFEKPACWQMVNCLSGWS